MQKEQARGMKRSAGHTLLELVVVIAILGVLATMAMVRFANLQEEASRAVLLSMEGTVRSASTLVSARARALGQTQGLATIDMGDGRTLRVHSGYARAHWNQTVRYMLNLDATSFSPANQVCVRDWCGRGNQRSVQTDAGLITTPGRAAKVWPRGSRWNDRCGVHFINHEDGRPPEIGISTSGC